MPELYLLIIFSAVFAPSVALLLILLSLFGWMGLSDYVRAEFLRNRQMDYVRAAKALGVGSSRIMWRHILPNSMTPVVTFLPFRMSAAILALTSLDFLGLGVPPGTPSLGELLSQGKANLDAWWISLSTFAVLVITLLLLTFGRCLRDSLDPRRPNALSPTRAAGAAALASGTSRLTAARRRERRCWTSGPARGLRGKEVLHGVDFSIARGNSPGGRIGLRQDSPALSLLGLVQNATVTGSAVFGLPGIHEPARPAHHVGARAPRHARQEIAMIFQGR
jgi:ABC-type proline/glycine betaine transport system permease subunit